MNLSENKEYLEKIRAMLILNRKWKFKKIFTKKIEIKKKKERRKII